MYRLTMREQAIRFLQRIPGSRDERRICGAEQSRELRPGIGSAGFFVPDQAAADLEGCGDGGSDSNGAESHAKRRFPDSLGVGDLTLESRSRIGTCRRD